MKILRFSSFVAAVVLAGLSVAPAHADGLVQVASFRSGSSRLFLETFTQGATTVGVISIKGVGKAESYSYNKSEAVTLLALWNKAQLLSGASYVAAGSVSQTGSDIVATLLLAGGPSMRFSIADAIRGFQSFDLAPADYPAFDAALHKVGDVVTE